ncbi:hypothetical protein ACGFMM_24255 [Streptomyces sp. NPDC048604]|uniref:hypothetical protein n=1 Tax=Streptomyces sp. NPDC048604 TaxID=3365578 RepID=UPI0037169ADB
MKIDSLLEDMAGDDAARVEAAVRQLAEQPGRSVPALLRAAAAVEERAGLRPFLEALRHIGPPAFDEVLAAWQRKELQGWLAHKLLDGFDERCADQYAELASEGDYGRSGIGFRGLVRLQWDSETGVRALAKAFARGRAPVPHEASRYARLLHEPFRPRLRALRRDPAVPQQFRRGALAALVAGGGADALDERDRAAVARLIQVKIADETPQLPETTLSAWWMAVPGASYEGVFPALGLHDPQPITVTGGIQASEGRELTVPGPGASDRVVGRVFVTPELDGWRLVFGSSDLLIGYDLWDGMVEAVERVSAHCGHAQLFFLDDAGGSDVWFVAENGRVIRRYAADSEPEWEGDPLPWETLESDEPDDDVPPNTGTAGAREACVHLSVDPGEVGPETRVVGHGWLAVTAPDVGHGAFPGALRL